MNYLGKVGKAGAKLVSSCRDLYNDLNSANLTGAVDVVAVKQKDGTLKATPFHVRFGKWGVLRTGDLKEVEMEVNGGLVDVRMMLDETGSAFFSKLKPISQESSTSSASSLTQGQSLSKGEDYASHAPESIELKQNEEDSSISGSQREVEEVQDKGRTGVDRQDLNLIPRQEEESDGEEVFVPALQSPMISRSLPMDINRQTSHPLAVPMGIDWEERNVSQSRSLPTEEIMDVGVLSDSALETKDHISLSVPTNSSGALSDSEMERVKRSDSQSGQCLNRPETNLYRRSLWGTLASMWKRKNQRLSRTEDGIYLAQLDSKDLDSEELARYFPATNRSLAGSTNGNDAGEAASANSASSGVGSSPCLSPVHPTFPLRPASPSHETESEDESSLHLELIPMFEDIAVSQCGGLNSGTITEENFKKQEINFAEFCTKPDILTHPDLVVRMGGRYYNWAMAAPMLMSVLLYQQVLPVDAYGKLAKKHLSKKRQQSFWNFWARGGQELDIAMLPPEVIVANTDPKDIVGKDEGEENRMQAPRKIQTPALHSSPSLKRLSSTTIVDLASSDEEEAASRQPQALPRTRQKSLRRRKFAFTNELTSEELLNLPLKPGVNELVFSITTKYQGTAKAFCNLYVWEHSDKIVISDFDGTITRSDVAGQVLPLLGKDWTQNGVIELYSAISNNGYHLIYLSSRSIGQAWYTKNYLRHTRRGECYLPDGPLLVTPFSLYIAFKKEVIERKPEEFKIWCLEQIRALFPPDHNPFHAGFGNKPSDATAYQKVDVPSSRTFSVNHKGEIKSELTWTFRSSYNGLMEFVDAQFPPVSKAIMSKADDETSQCNLADDFNTFVFWRESYDMVDLPDDFTP